MTLTTNEVRHYAAAELCPLCGYRKWDAVWLMLPAAEAGLWKRRFRWPKRRMYGWECPECGTAVISHQEVTRDVTCP